MSGSAAPVEIDDLPLVEVKPDHDLLLLSDIHLGSDLKRKDLRRAGSLEALCRKDAMDRAFAAFFDEYATRPPEGRHWRLILDGDVVDFIGINVTPKDLGDLGSFPVSDEEEVYGLEPGADRCAWLLRQVIRRHPLFFRHLAGFLAHGHELIIIRGNHDAAFFWPEVQKTFVGGLRAEGKQLGLGEEALEQVASAVRFEDWFYLEAGRIYVEHGHAHDEYCADPGVRPTDARRPDLLSQPVTTHALRYFGNRFPSLDLDDVDTWTAWQFVRWAFVTENIFKVIAAFLQTVTLLLLPSLRRALRRMRRSRLAHAEPSDPDEITGEIEIASRVRARLSKGVQGAEKFAVGIARLVRRTAEVSFGGILQMFYIDRMATLGGGLAVSAGCVALNIPWAVRLGLAATFLAGAVLFDQHLKMTRRVAIGPKLRVAAEDLSHLIDVPLVVMGHSHKAVDTVLPGGRTRYINLGTWMGAANPQRAAETGLPHLVVRDGVVDFLRWHPRGT